MSEETKETVAVAASSEQGIIAKLIDQTPNWALGVMGSFFMMAATFKIVGIDFAGPINQITAAYTSAIERQAAGMLKFDEATARMEAMLNRQQASIDSTNAALGALQTTIDSITETVSDTVETLDNHEKRLIVLEQDTHPKSHKEIKP